MIPAKVLVLAIDAASPDLLLAWSREGVLPRLAAVLQRGLIGRVGGLDGFCVGSTWPSFFTGCSPARHGVHYGVQLVPGTYDFCGNGDSRPLGAIPFWTRLGEAGRRVVLLDVPLARLDPSQNHVPVVEWGCHDAIGGPVVGDNGLERAILARHGPHPIRGACDAERRTAEHFTAFTEALLRGVRLRAEITRDLQRQGDWDLLVQVFSEAHCVGHQCWHLHDPTHPGYDAATAKAVPGGSPVRQVYRAIDAAIGEILDEAGDALVLIVVPHGMSYQYGGDPLLREILFRLGVASPPVRAPEPPTPLRDVAGSVWRALPSGTRALLRPLREKLRRKTPWRPSLGVDPARSSCFRVDNGLLVSGIRLNLKGREPQGQIEPGLPAESFLDELATDLLAISDPATGRRLIHRLIRPGDLYRGDRLGDLPDLLVEWNEEIPMGSTIVGTGAGAVLRATSPKIGVVEVTNSYCRSGDHRSGGLFVAVGPGLQRGELDRQISLLDFAPTLAVLGGVDPGDCDGAPVPELV